MGRPGAEGGAYQADKWMGKAEKSPGDIGKCKPVFRIVTRAGLFFRRTPSLALRAPGAGQADRKNRALAKVDGLPPCRNEKGDYFNTV